MCGNRWDARQTGRQSRGNLYLLIMAVNSGHWDAYLRPGELRISLRLSKIGTVVFTSEYPVWRMTVVCVLNGLNVKRWRRTSFQMA